MVTLIYPIFLGTILAPNLTLMNSKTDIIQGSVALIELHQHNPIKTPTTIYYIQCFITVDAAHPYDPSVGV